MRYTNKEHTMVDIGDISGKLKDLIRLDYLKEDDVIEPYVEPVPTTADKISELEAKVTPRRLREALAGDTAFITDIDKQISVLRGEIV